MVQYVEIFVLLFWNFICWNFHWVACHDGYGNIDGKSTTLRPVKSIEFVCHKTKSDIVRESNSVRPHKVLHQLLKVHIYYRR